MPNVCGLSENIYPMSCLISRSDTSQTEKEKCAFASPKQARDVFYNNHDDHPNPLLLLILW